MKKIYALILLLVMVVSLTACGEKTTVDENEANVVETITEEIVSDEETVAGKAFEDYVASDVEEVASVLWEEFNEISTVIDSYDKYKENVDQMGTFYAGVLEDTRLLCIKMREYSLNYAEEVMSADSTNDEKYDALEEIYDCIYEDAGDDIYDEIYDGVLEDMYDVFYDGILDDAYDTVDYSEWTDARSNEYEWWSDTRSDVYEEWSEFRSDVYEFWSDMRSELWDDDVERAEKVMSDFAEDIEKLKGNDTSNDSVEADTEEAITESVTETTDEETTVEASKDLVDGMRPEFKEAMDSYEAFYDEYCAFMKKYNDNPTDLTLLAGYADMLSKGEDMNAAFEEWDESEMNDVELKYYLDVNNRVMQKLLDVM